MSAALRSAVIDIGMSLMLRRARLAFWGGRTGMSSRSVDASGRSPDRRLIQDLVSEARDLWRASPLPHLRERAKLRAVEVTTTLIRRHRPLKTGVSRRPMSPLFPQGRDKG